jgi:transcriptional regulator with XRE-family HTH domain
LETIRRIRTMRGMNQVDLARASGVAQNTISEIETGRREARPATLGKIANALGVEISDFFEEGDIPPKAERSSSHEPSLNDALDELRISRFAQAITAAAEKWREVVVDTDMDDKKRFGFIDAALDLSDLISEQALEEDWATLTDQERREIVTTMEQLGAVAEIGIRHLEKSAQTEAERRRFKENRNQIRQWTRQISA